MAGIDSYTKLMLHMDGSDASTTFIDDGTTGHSPVANGDAQIDTAQSVFGGASGLLDGTVDNIEVPDHADWDMYASTTTEFTIDFRVRFASLASSPGFVSQHESNTQYWGIFLDGGVLFFNSAYTTGKLKFTCNWSPSIDTWYHIEVARSATKRFIFINGIEQSLVLDDNNSITALGAALKLGTYTRESYFLNGWLEEFRVSKGIVRNTTNFTPPTAPYDGGTTVAISSAQALVLAQPSPTIDIVTNPTIIPATQALTIDLPVPHIITNHPTPVEQPANITLFDPEIIIGISSEPNSLDMTMNIWSPTIIIISETIISVSTQTLGLSLPAPIIAVPSSVTLALSEQASVLVLPEPTIVVAFTMFASHTLPMLTLSATLIVGQTHSFASTLPMLTLNAIMGTKINHTLPMLTLNANLTSSDIGSLTKSLPMLTLSATLTVENTLISTTSLPMFTLDAGFKVGGIHTFTSTLPIMTLSANMVSSVPMVFSATLPLLSLSASGYNSDNLIFSKTLPILTLRAFMTSYDNRII